jgi:hypothetical protein
LVVTVLVSVLVVMVMVTDLVSVLVVVVTGYSSGEVEILGLFWIWR